MGPHGLWSWLSFLEGTALAHLQEGQPVIRVLPAGVRAPAVSALAQPWKSLHITVQHWVGSGV